MNFFLFVKGFQMVVLLGLKPRLGRNLLLLVYKTSDANITSQDHYILVGAAGNAPAFSLFPEQVGSLFPYAPTKLNGPSSR